MIVATIGFTKKSAEEFFTLLERGGVRTLVDVRLNPNSQLAGFAQGRDLPYLLRGLAAHARDLSIKRVEQFLGRLTLVGSAPGANVAKLQPKTYGRASGLSVDSALTLPWDRRGVRKPTASWRRPTGLHDSLPLVFRLNDHPTRSGSVRTG